MPNRKPLIDELELQALFLNTSDVSELRGALAVREHLGKREADFVLAATRVFAALGKQPGPAPSAALHFGRSWVDHFGQALRAFRQVLGSVTPS